MQRVLGARGSLGWAEDTALGGDIETRASSWDLSLFSAPFANSSLSPSSEIPLHIQLLY